MVMRRIPLVLTHREAKVRREHYAAPFRARSPDAVDCLERNGERLVAFDDFPAAHRRHLRTTNPVAIPFAADRLGTQAAKRYQRVTGATALSWWVMRVAESRFRRLEAPTLLAAMYAGPPYQDGKPIHPYSSTPKTEAAGTVFDTLLDQTSGGRRVVCTCDGGGGGRIISVGATESRLFFGLYLSAPEGIADVPETHRANSMPIRASATELFRPQVNSIDFLRFTPLLSLQRRQAWGTSW
jgi:hypothetical protein